MLRLAGIDVDAISLGGVRTCIQLPAHDVAFDMGCCPDRAVHQSRVLFTHAHMDHMGAVNIHCATRALLKLPPPTYVLPPGVQPAFDAMMGAWGDLDGTQMAYTAHTLAPGEVIRLKQDVIARPFRTIHRVVSQGYVLYRQKRKLRPEWRGRPGVEIAAARKRGEAVLDEVEEPEVAFTGDTRIEGLDDHPETYRARLLIMEVTFHDDRVPVRKSRAMGHIHLDEVIARAERFDNEAILITHRSTRYGEREVSAMLDARMPPSLRQRVTLLPDTPASPDSTQRP
ncbi:MAG: ribonuclease Z [Myxococcota bacterium]|jgi:ribonuclease Z